MAKTPPSTQTCLTDLKKGQAALITAMEMGDESLNKLVEMGLGVGRRVSLVGRAPMGDPVVIEVIGYRLAMRAKEARLIKVAPVEGTVRVTLGDGKNPPRPRRGDAPSKTTSIRKKTRPPTKRSPGKKTR